MQALITHNDGRSEDDGMRRISRRAWLWLGCGCALLVLLPAVIWAGSSCALVLGVALLAPSQDTDLQERNNLDYAERSPVWSADGQFLIVNIGAAIYRVSVSGDTMKRIPGERNRSQYSPALSPSGRVAYMNYERKGGLYSQFLTTEENDWRQIETVSVDGGGVESVIELYRRHRSPKPTVPIWSPDGMHIAFVSEVPLDIDKWEEGIYVVDTQGRVIAREPGHFVRELRWSSDGVYLGYRESLTVAVSEFVAEQGRLAQVANSGPNSDRLLSLPGWSPMENRLYYTSQRYDELGVSRTTLHSMTADGAEAMVIADLGEQPMFEDVRVSPDGSQLLLVARESRKISRVNIDGTGLITIFRQPLPRPEKSVSDVPFAEPPPSPNQRIFASWSPDGSEIAILDEYPDSAYALMTVKTDGSGLRPLVIRNEDGDPLPALAERP